MSVRFQRAPRRWALLPLAIAGGTIGAFVRGLLTLPFPHPLDAVPMIMAINVVGSAALGFVIAWAGSRTALRTFFGTGMIGGFTSYSALAPWLAGDAGNLVTAAIHGNALVLVLTVFALLVVVVAIPVAAAAGGFVAGQRLARRRA